MRTARQSRAIFSSLFPPLSRQPTNQRADLVSPKASRPGGSLTAPTWSPRGSWCESALLVAFPVLRFSPSLFRPLRPDLTDPRRAERTPQS